MAPLVQALAAGNRVMIKPSELTPRTALLLQHLLAQTFPADQVTVIIGDAQLASRFSELPFDHLLFTGSTQVGRLVMAAAARTGSASTPQATTGTLIRSDSLAAIRPAISSE